MSADQQNLFHSFEQFHLLTGESATFITDPAILNILSRVSGGDPSVIDGLLQVSGSNANLFLINPNGILLGENSVLNLQGSFTAVTADQVNFSTGAFGVVGTPDYAALVGNPQSFHFSLDTPGAVVNAGNLHVPAGESVVLVGGQVLNVGTIAAPGGNILISAVDGEQWVRIAQEGQLLNLEVATLSPRDVPALTPFAPLALPELLTGSAIAQATNVTVNLDGSITLDAAETPIPNTPGTAVVSGTLAATSDEQGGAITVLGPTLGLLNAAIDASGNGGGTIRLGGDYLGGGVLPTTAITFVDGASRMVADAIANGDGGTIIVWSDETTRSYGQLSAQGGSLTGDGGFVETSSRGYLDTSGIPDVTAANGIAGTWLLDPYNVEIVAAPETDREAFPSGNPFVAQAGAPAVISWFDLEAALSQPGATVTVTTGNGGPDRGNIRVAAFDLFTQTTSTLRLRAAGDIDLRAGLETVEGQTNFDFEADVDRNGDGAIFVDNLLSSGGGNITLTGDDVLLVSGAANVDAGGGELRVNRLGAPDCVDGCLTNPPPDPTTGDGGNFDEPLANEPALQNDFTGDVDFGEEPLPPDDFAGGDVFGDDFGGEPLPPDDFEGDDFEAGSDFDGDDFEGDDFDGDDFEGDDFGEDDLDSGNDNADIAEGDDFEGDDGDIEDEEPAENARRDRDQPANYGDEFAELSYEDLAFEDAVYAEEFVSYFDLPVAPEPDLASSATLLRDLANQTGTTSALIYARFSPADGAIAQAATAKQLQNPQPTDVLQLVLVTPEGQPQQLLVPTATREAMVATVRQLQIELTDRTRRRLNTYLAPSQDLYRWLIAPLEDQLREQAIGHLSFILAPGLRSLPLAALHDGEQFIIETYTVGLMPSLALTDTRYTDLRQAPVLAMGASEFTDQPDLPAVPFELSTIVGQLRQGQQTLNEPFTPQNLVALRQASDYRILHLATHGEFRPGGPDNSYIQFWDQRLQLNQIRELQLSDPPLDLLVMSACRTALGDTSAELGFAGLAVQAGVKSALATLWQVSDLETAGLMTEFYTQLNQQPYKAEALRQAQLAMLRGDVTVQDGVLSWNGGRQPLPDNLVNQRFGNTRHPYYWAAFTLVGSPW
jgi:filamentous hemagglutinin family protein